MPWPSVADRRAGVDRHVVEHHLAHGVAVQPHLPLGGAERQAVGVGRARRSRTARARRRRTVRAKVGVVVGVAGVADPRLAAAQPVAVGSPSSALAGGAGRHRADVGAGQRLGQAVGAELVAARACRAAGRPAARAVPNVRHGVGGQRVHRDTDGHAHPGRRRSPRRPAGRPRRAGRSRRTPRGGAARAARPRPAVRTPRVGKARRSRRRARRRRPWAAAPCRRSRGSGR